MYRRELSRVPIVVLACSRRCTLARRHQARQTPSAATCTAVWNSYDGITSALYRQHTYRSLTQPDCSHHIVFLIRVDELLRQDVSDRETRQRGQGLNYQRVARQSLVVCRPYSRHDCRYNRRLGQCDALVRVAARLGNVRDAVLRNQ